MEDNIDAQISALKRRVRVDGVIVPVEDADITAGWTKVAGSLICPDSYRAYCKAFGSGFWHPRLMIAVPGHADSNLDIASTHGLYTEMVTRRAAGAQGLRQKICIGGDDTGWSLCLDYSTGGQEPSVCLVEPDYFDVHPCGGSILEFIEDYWLGKKIDSPKPIGGDRWSPQPVFEPLAASGYGR